MRDYTLAQVRAFTEAAARDDRRSLRDQATAARAAQYDENSWAAYMRKLEN